MARKPYRLLPEERPDSADEAADVSLAPAGPEIEPHRREPASLASMADGQVTTKTDAIEFDPLPLRQPVVLSCECLELGREFTRLTERPVADVMRVSDERFNTRSRPTGDGKTQPKIPVSEEAKRLIETTQLTQDARRSNDVRSAARDQTAALRAR